MGGGARSWRGDRLVPHTSAPVRTTQESTARLGNPVRPLHPPNPQPQVPPTQQMVTERLMNFLSVHLFAIKY